MIDLYNTLLEKKWTIRQISTYGLDFPAPSGQSPFKARETPKTTQAELAADRYCTFSTC
jgi:hypothetical protein